MASTLDDYLELIDFFVICEFYSAMELQYPCSFLSWSQGRGGMRSIFDKFMFLQKLYQLNLLIFDSCSP